VTALQVSRKYGVRLCSRQGVRGNVSILIFLSGGFQKLHSARRVAIERDFTNEPLSLHGGLMEFRTYGAKALLKLAQTCLPTVSLRNPVARPLKTTC